MTRFTPQFLDEIRARLRASDVIGRTVKLTKEGREFRGLSPFTQEKTPSFFVNDEKGKFFDFSAGKSGDIIGFLMETQNLAFPEAVASLAELAGLDLPKSSPEEEERARSAKGVAEANLEAAKFFREQLTRKPGKHALAYLEQRGVGAAARGAFGLGYAPGDRTALRDTLMEKGFDLSCLVDAGLVIRPDDGEPYDKFRDRVMFPILSRGKVIAFGGRALSRSVSAKYMNSPETVLFHKSATLYGYDRARKKLKDDTPLLLAEGYMDVIALDEAGYAAVAPLGTAVTEAQLGLLWRVCDEPVVCLDGDRAGQKAAFRVIDRALPLLAPGKSLRFAFLPEGKDPDDVLRGDGAKAMAQIVAAARPLAEVLWAHETEAHPQTTPEQVAGFRRHLRDRLAQIQDIDVRRAYQHFFTDKLRAENGAAGPRTGGRPPAAGWRPEGARGRPSSGGFRPFAPPLSVSPALKAVNLNRTDARTVTEALLVLTLVFHPSLFKTCEDEIFALELVDPNLSALLGHLVSFVVECETLDRESLENHISRVEKHQLTFAHWRDHKRLRLERFLRPETDDDQARQGWLNALSKHRFDGELAAEVDEAARSAYRTVDEERLWREVIRHRTRLVNDSKPDGG
ncbi:DNA primase [Parvularcula bermudensis HTCC2503]|uniref:DNA primase n=1 Tax=Parvularcula bermudensis (strain ATCC BAA-594 / HTCC2503 / KCTC 12087) TaxID=314260 RepID=E0TGQ0_PARBH|nr:DNA primase [Parvularcula bermudensis]ADM10659.1 DNA primase [Parvularcula bermudensis HTCC2503]